MYNLLLPLLLGYITKWSYASFPDDLGVRAPACQSNAAIQISKCKTATQFCSRFIGTLPPEFFKTKVTTKTATVTSTSTVTATTIEYSQARATCANSKRVAEPAPPAAGPSCNVKGFDPYNIESACSCLPKFTFKGKRPKPTTTHVVTLTATTTKVVSTSIVVKPPTQTLVRFQFHPTSGYQDLTLKQINGSKAYSLISPGYKSSPSLQYAFQLPLKEGPLQADSPISKAESIGIYAASNPQNHLGPIYAGPQPGFSQLTCADDFCGSAVRCMFPATKQPMYFWVCGNPLYEGNHSQYDNPLYGGSSDELSKYDNGGNCTKLDLYSTAVETDT